MPSPPQPRRRAAGPAVKKKPKKPGDTKRRVKRVALVLLATGLVFGLLGVGAFVVAYNAVEIPDPNEDFEAQTSKIYYADGETVLGEFATQDRESIPLDEMPQTMKDAVVAAENQTFWTDKGIDPRGILRAAFSNAQGNATQGASTITQQYVKILYLTQERSLDRKVREAILSLKLQRKMSKEQVLEGYLNTIYFGRGAYGVEAAAQAFFDKPAAELTLRESAVLASVLNNPTNLDPANGKEAKQDLKARYEYVLDSMADMGTISAAEADQAKKRLPKFPKIEAQSQYGGQRGHMLKLVRDELLRLGYTEEDIDGGGLRVTTTFTQEAMAAAEEGQADAAARGHERRPAARRGGDRRGRHRRPARLLRRPGLPRLPDQLGGRGRHGGLDVQGLRRHRRDQGRLLAGGHLQRRLPDGPARRHRLREPGQHLLRHRQHDRGDGGLHQHRLHRHDQQHGGRSAEDRRRRQRPRHPRQRARQVRHPHPVDRPPAQPRRRAGQRPGQPDQHGQRLRHPGQPGQPGRRPRHRQGRPTASGETDYTFKRATREVVDPDIAADVSYALQQVVEVGSGSAAQELDRPVAGKTGTATNDKGEVSSSWFVGTTPQISTAVMYVRGKGREQLEGFLPEFFGGSYPARTWTDVMGRVMEGMEVEEFPEPVYVDGDAPEEGHEPYTPPPSPTRKPPPTKKPTPTLTEGTPTDEPTPTETVPTDADRDGAAAADELGAAATAARPRRPRRRRRRQRRRRASRPTPRARRAGRRSTAKSAYYSREPSAPITPRAALW